MQILFTWNLSDITSKLYTVDLSVIIASQVIFHNMWDTSCLCLMHPSVNFNGLLVIVNKLKAEEDFLLTNMFLLYKIRV
jgi:hypothetical protein